MADDQRPAAVFERIENAAQRTAEAVCFFLDEGTVCLLKGADVAAARLPGHGKPALLDGRTKRLVDGHASGRALARARQETGQRLGGALGAGRNQEIIGRPEPASDLNRGRNTFGGQPVAVAGRVTPQFDGLHEPSPSIDLL